jgi:hypothetical protein
MRAIGILLISAILIGAQGAPLPIPSKEKEQVNEKELARMRGAWELESETHSGIIEAARGVCPSRPKVLAFWGSDTAPFAEL